MMYTWFFFYFVAVPLSLFFSLNIDIADSAITTIDNDDDDFSADDDDDQVEY